ncbi:hypothetical protein F2Q70_00025629 [Brassica cretica]|uniref:Uncharacterized protein n=2 Tax=Brassica cretica TaxID=69181 RepID=A0A3N6S9J0_BRACR|nr:hypothetical protein F2Q70_00025629 [Brassica cretica]KAF3556594.1 hypothetical protein F2Q69_00012272 [Brassica cretica]KAF3579412.1 hypothetical protein DY000_02030431 [Brassica cretica]
MQHHQDSHFHQRTLGRVNHHRPSGDVNLDDATAANNDRGSGDWSSVLFNNLLVVMLICLTHSKLKLNLCD